MKRLLLSIFILLFATSAEAAMMTKEITYKDGDKELTGYLAYDDTAKLPAPGILVVHEWWGLTDHPKKRAEALAKLGYVAFALDMFGTKTIATTPDEAKALTKDFYEDRSLMQKRAEAGLDVLKKQPQVDPSKIAVIGFCFGGTTALELARAGADVKGVVSFHGGLTTPTPAKAGEVKAEVLALNGGNDPMSPEADKEAFNKEMTDAKVQFKSVDYPGATHAFTNPDATAKGKQFNLPIAYDETADKKSWAEMESFFNRIFK